MYCRGENREGAWPGHWGLAPSSSLAAPRRGRARPCRARNPNEWGVEGEPRRSKWDPIPPDPSWPRWQHSIKELWTVWVNKQRMVVPVQGGYNMLWCCPILWCMYTSSGEHNKEKDMSFNTGWLCANPATSVPPELVRLCDLCIPPGAENKNTFVSFTSGLPAPSKEHGPYQSTACRFLRTI